MFEGFRPQIWDRGRDDSHLVVDLEGANHEYASKNQYNEQDKDNSYVEDCVG